MKRLEQLPQITEKGLGGLTAGPGLKHRIERAAQGERQARRTRIPAWAPALCCALVLAVVLMTALPQLTGLHQEENNPGALTQSQRAGNATEAPRSRADLPEGSVALSNTGSAPVYRSIWADAESGSYPLIGVNGKYYRMLVAPASVAADQLGESLGTVAEFTTEPSLSGNDVIMSNQVLQGETVYAINGMGDTLVAAAVNGSYRVFQRVSFNGNAVKGSESLEDTLQVSGHVVAVELSDVGTITDPQTAESLVDTLLRNAAYESSGQVSGRQSLLIQLDNGLTVQLVVRDDKISGCGTWSCPEFMDAFAQAL